LTYQPLQIYDSTEENMTEQKKDWVVPAAVAVGAVGVAGGLYLFLRKPKGLDPGDVLLARFNIVYLGDAGTFVIQVSLGSIVIGDFFNHIEGLTWTREVALPGPGEYSEDLECPLPEAIKARAYSAEALIRTPDMDPFTYLIKDVRSDVITVR